MNFEEILPALKEGKKIRRKSWHKIHGVQKINATDDSIVDENGEYFPFVLEDFLSNDWEVVEETILSDKESEYLKIVCALFKERVASITRFKVTEDDCFIQINLKNPAYIIALPFKSETNYFVGMKQGKQYTLKDLGINYD